MSMADEIERLHQLQLAGALTEAEFAEAKRRVLAGAAPASEGGRNDTVGRAANRLVSYYIISPIIGLVAFLVIYLFFFKPMWDKSRKDFDDRWNETGQRLSMPTENTVKRP